MRMRFTKMHGAGNDFVVLDGTRVPVSLSAAQAKYLGDRRFGVGADQILIIERSSTPGVDFSYRIHNNSGEEVEHCGNGARCFMRYVHEHGLTDKTRVRVETVNNLLELQLQADGRVTVDMNLPIFDLQRVPFDASGLQPRHVGNMELWPLELSDGSTVAVAVLSMGNPHAVMRVDDTTTTPVAHLGPLIEAHPRFARKVNAGFVQVQSPTQALLRVYERGAGETLACGTGACAAVVAGIRLGWFGRGVEVHTYGGALRIEWPADAATVLMTGPATTVFEGEIEL